MSLQRRFTRPRDRAWLAAASWAADGMTWTSVGVQRYAGWEGGHFGGEGQKRGAKGDHQHASRTIVLWNARPGGARAHLVASQPYGNWTVDHKILSTVVYIDEEALLSVLVGSSPLLTTQPVLKRGRHFYLHRLKTTSQRKPLDRSCRYSSGVPQWIVPLPVLPAGDIALPKDGTFKLPPSPNNAGESGGHIPALLRNAHCFTDIATVFLTTAGDSGSVRRSPSRRAATPSAPSRSRPWRETAGRAARRPDRRKNPLPAAFLG